MTPSTTPAAPGLASDETLVAYLRSLTPLERILLNNSVIRAAQQLRSAIVASHGKAR